MIASAAAAEALELLSAVAGLDAGAAAARLRELAARHPRLRMHLVPERNEMTGRTDYGVLVREPDGEAIYATRRAAASTPWLLHEIHSFREGDLLYVDGETLSVAQGLASLDELLVRESVQQRLVDVCILRRHLGERRIPVSDDELQEAMDDFRRRRGLHSAAAAERWLREHGLTQAQLEGRVAQEVRVGKLRREVCGGARVEAWFEAHPAERARAALVRVRFATEERARAALPADPTSEAAFFALASRVAAEELAATAPSPRVESVVVSRAELAPGDADRIFSRAGAIAGPLRAAEGVYLAWVAAIDSAPALDARLRDVIERRLFADWLAEQRGAARIEWSWGRDPDAST